MIPAIQTNFGLWGDVIKVKDLLSWRDQLFPVCVKLIICAFLLVVKAAYSSSPWFTGPLFALPGQTVPKGHINVEPYFFYIDNFARFNQSRKSRDISDIHVASIVPFFSYGLTDFMDIQALFFYSNASRFNTKSISISDTNIQLGFRTLKQKGMSPVDLRVTVAHIFPTGKYKNLRYDRFGTDAMGLGSHQTVLGLNFQRLDYITPEHALRSRLNIIGQFARKVQVEGLNSYGGGIGTKGMVKPGSLFQADLAFEYQLTQNWVPVFEILYTTRQQSTFIGNPGRTPFGDVTRVGRGESDVLSLAPAIEYNFNANIGIISGVWFPINGRNSNNFLSGIIAVNFFY